MNKIIPKLKFCAILVALLCTTALAVACNDTPDTPAETTVTTEVTTEPNTKEETEIMTEEKTTETETETECHIIFEDNFDGAELDTAKWTKLPENADGENSVMKDDMSALDGEGRLVIRAEWDAEANRLVCGGISTEGLFAYGYGYYEATVKFSVTYGAESCFQVLVGQQATSSPQNGVEINVLHTSADQQGLYTHTLSWQRSFTPKIESWINIYDGRFHTFGVLRDETGYTFFIDGVQSGKHATERQVGACSEDGYLRLLWEATEDIGTPESVKSLPAEMVVDCVRVYSSLPEALNKPVNSEPELVFSDDFDGDELDNTKWEKCPEWERQGKSRWENDLSYLDSNGNLILQMVWDEEAQLVNCGAVRTLGRFEYGYGYYEARIKFTDHYGAWGAFWMMCGNVGSEINGAADGVEIDIIESIDNQNGTYNHNLHWDGYGAAHKAAPPPLLKKINIYDGEYHTFGVLRSEIGYFFYIDGTLSGLVSSSQCEPCPQNGYIKLTCEAAEWSGAGTPECIADLPAQMVVDYVRVYASMPDLNQ